MTALDEMKNPGISPQTTGSRRVARLVQTWVKIHESTDERVMDGQKEETTSELFPTFWILMNSSWVRFLQNLFCFS